MQGTTVLTGTLLSKCPTSPRRSDQALERSVPVIGLLGLRPTPHPTGVLLCSSGWGGDGGRTPENHTEQHACQQVLIGRPWRRLEDGRSRIFSLSASSSVPGCFLSVVPAHSGQCRSVVPVPTGQHPGGHSSAGAVTRSCTCEWQQPPAAVTFCYLHSLFPC